MVRFLGFFISGLFFTLFFTARGFACEDPAYDFQDSVFGTWSGDAVNEDEPWQVEIHFARNPETGCAEIRGSFPEAGIFFYSIENYTRNEIAFSFEVGGIGWVMNAAFDPETGTIAGTWTRPTNNLVVPFNLRKVSESAPFFRFEDIRFESPDGAKLVGTLILPEGAGPFPAIVWTHGSGRQTRATSFYASRAYLAASLGMASFIYDKRGQGESTGEGYESLANMFIDAAGAVDAVRHNPNVIPGRVGIGGYSQGGWIAPEVAGSDPEIAFVIAGSAPGIPPGEQNVFSMKVAMERELGPEITAEAVAGLRQVNDYFRTGEGYDEIMAMLADEDAKAWSDLDMFRGMIPADDGVIPETFNPADYAEMSFDALPFWEKITVPVFLAWGSTDHNLPAYDSQEVIEKALARGGNTQVTSMVLPGAGHGLELRRPNYLSYKDRPEDEKYFFFHMHPNYFPAFITFIKARVAE